LPAAAVAGLLAYVSFAILHLVCLLCVAADLALVGLLIGTALSDRLPIADVPRGAARDMSILLSNTPAMTISLLFAILVGAAVAVFTSEGASANSTDAFSPLADQQRTDFERWLVSRPQYAGLAASGGVRVLVVKFNDYQCPPCGRAFREYEEVFERYEREEPGAVRLVRRDYPLDGKCNPYVANGGKHPSACEAAVAARLSQAHERADAMERWLFSNQSSLTPQLIREAAHEVGHADDFDVRYGETVKLVQADINLARQLEVTATPTFFLNGRKIEGVIPARYFYAAIDFELRHTRPTR
jgi:protein-disulfide isomerase